MIGVKLGGKRKTQFCKCGHCKSIHRLYASRNPGCNVDGCKCRVYRPVDPADKAREEAGELPPTPAATAETSR